VTRRAAQANKKRENSEGLMNTPIIDASAFPIVRWTTPKTISDDEARDMFCAFNALLDRGPRFVVIFEGEERPEGSKTFMRDYKTWFKSQRTALKAKVAGAVRIEPDPERRSSLLRQVMNVALLTFMPYPFRIAMDEAEATEHARSWLGDNDRELL
jgi:hypothetical protein